MTGAPSPGTGAPADGAAPFLTSLHHFRAIAIVIIVAGHSYGVAGLRFDSLPEQTLANLISGGTALFVFISGFLFHHLYAERYRFGRFVAHKARRLLPPYLLLGLVPVAASVWHPGGYWSGAFPPLGPGWVERYLLPALEYLWSGAFLTAYWYIPFIFLTFLLSPLHRHFCRLGTGAQLALVGLLGGLSMLLHRPVENLDPLQSVVYFTPAYLIGICCSRHRERLYEVFAGREYLPALLAVYLAGFQAYLGDTGRYHKPPFEFGGIDLVLPQKLLLCLFFLVFLRRFEGRRNRLLETLAATSFATFFLHPLLLKVLERSLDGPLAADAWSVYGLAVTALLATCALIAGLVKRLLPRHSRLLLGY